MLPRWRHQRRGRFPRLSRTQRRGVRGRLPDRRTPCFERVFFLKTTTLRFMQIKGPGRCNVTAGAGGRGGAEQRMGFWRSCFSVGKQWLVRSVSWADRFKRKNLRNFVRPHTTITSGNSPISADPPMSGTPPSIQEKGIPSGMQGYNQMLPA